VVTIDDQRRLSVRRMFSVLVVAGLFFAGVGCSSGSSPTADSSAGTESVTTDDTGNTGDTGDTADTGDTDTGDTDTGDRSLADQLLTEEDLPSGWKAGEVTTGDSGDSDTDSSDTPECLKPFDAVADPVDKAQVELRYGSTEIPTLSEDLGDFGNTAESTFAELDRSLGDCTDITITDDTGGVVTGSIEPLDIGEQGDQSTAYTMSLEQSGTKVGLNLALVRKGDLLAFFVWADLGTPDKQDFEDAVTAGVDHIA
jgi:hypothetical protein